VTLRKRLERLEAKHPPADTVLLDAFEAVLRILPDALLFRLRDLLALQRGPEWYAHDAASDAASDAIAPGLAAWSHAVARMGSHERIPAPPSIPHGAMLATIRKAETLEGAERDAHIIAAVILGIAERLRARP